MTGKRRGTSEVAAAVDALFTWAAWADKYDGRAKGVPIRGIALAMNEAVGKIAAFAGGPAPLANLATLIGAALSMGNRLTLIAPEAAPLIATDLMQVLETSDIPAGVVNILTGDHAELAPHVAGHADLDAVWSFSGADLAAVIEREAAGNLKRTWIAQGEPSAGAFLDAATEVKTIWIPYGE